MAAKPEIPPIYDPPPPPPTFGLIAAGLLVAFGLLHIGVAWLSDAGQVTHLALGVLEVLSGIAIGLAAFSWRKKHDAWLSGPGPMSATRAPSA